MPKKFKENMHLTIFLILFKPANTIDCINLKRVSVFFEIKFLFKKWKKKNIT